LGIALWPLWHDQRTLRPGSKIYVGKVALASPPPPVSKTKGGHGVPRMPLSV
jgi:hypothetical protein